MIITIESIKGNSGQGVPMYSRAGRSTINQYLAFSPKDEMGGYQRTDSPVDKQIEDELKVLQERKDEMKVQSEQKKDKSYAEKEERRKKVEKLRKLSSSFKAVSREKRIRAHSNKTNAPEVGKYTPKYDLIKVKTRKTTIYENNHQRAYSYQKHGNLMISRNNICHRVFRSIESNKGQYKTKQDAHGSHTQPKTPYKDNEGEENQTFEDEEDELESPSPTHDRKASKVISGQKGKKLNKQPSGSLDASPIRSKSFTKRTKTSASKKKGFNQTADFRKTDSNFAYKNYYLSNNYHLVKSTQNKNNQFEIVQNSEANNTFYAHKPAWNFENISTRKPNLVSSFSIGDRRRVEEMPVEKLMSPTKNKHVSCVQINKQTPRNNLLFKKPLCTRDYPNQKDNVMEQRRRVLTFEKMQDRDYRKSIYVKPVVPEQYNQDQVEHASMRVGRPRAPEFSHQRPRDNSMYTTTDALYNIWMENNKIEQQEKDQKLKAKSLRMYKVKRKRRR